MKKTFSFLTALTMLFLFSVTSQGMTTATVFADPVAVAPGKTVMIPVKITDNPGLMGFKLNVDYDKAALVTPAALRGSVTASGLFNDSIKPDTSGSFSVIWSDTKNMSSNGTLFVLQFSVPDNVTDGRYIIRLSFEQGDTFNEKWEDVRLDCKDITVTLGSVTTVPVTAEATTEPTTKPDYTTTSPAVEPETADNDLTQPPPGIFIPAAIDSGFILAAIDAALSNLGVKNTALLENSQKLRFIEAVINNLNAFGTEQVVMPDKDADSIIKDLDSAYSNAKADDYVKTVLNNIDGNKIIAAVDNKLAEFGVKTIEELSESQKQQFVDEISAQLNGYQPDAARDLKGLGAAAAAAALQELYNKAKTENETNATETASTAGQNENRIGLTTPQTVLAAAGIIALAIAVVLLIRKRARAGKSHQIKTAESPEESE